MLLLSLCAGCATTHQLDPNYQAMLNAYATQGDLLSITCPEGGCVFTSLKVRAPQMIPQRQADPPHPAWRVADSLIRAGGVVGGIWAAGNALEGIVGASRGYTSYQSGGDMAVSGSSVANPISTTTQTTTTETWTNTPPGEAQQP